MQNRKDARAQRRRKEEMNSFTWTAKLLEELNKRTAEFESGKVEGYSWEQVKARAKESTKTKHA